MNQNEIDWKKGRVVFWDLNEFDPNLPLERQLILLKEDLAQISYNGDLILDVGWFPSFDENGEFRVVVVKRENWDEPLFERTTNQAAMLMDLIDEGVSSIAK